MAWGVAGETPYALPRDEVCSIIERGCRRRDELKPRGHVRGVVPRVLPARRLTAAGVHREPDSDAAWQSDLHLLHGTEGKRENRRLAGRGGRRPGREPPTENQPRGCQNRKTTLHVVEEFRRAAGRDPLIRILKPSDRIPHDLHARHRS